MTTIFCHVVATVSFNQSIYNVTEKDGYLEAVLSLTNPSSADITITIIDDGSSAMGK